MTTVTAKKGDGDINIVIENNLFSKNKEAPVDKKRDPTPARTRTTGFVNPFVEPAFLSNIRQSNARKGMYSMEPVQMFSQAGQPIRPGMRSVETGMDMPEMRAMETETDPVPVPEGLPVGVPVMSSMGTGMDVPEMSSMATGTDPVPVPEMSSMATGMDVPDDIEPIDTLPEMPDERMTPLPAMRREESMRPKRMVGFEVASGEGDVATPQETIDFFGRKFDEQLARQALSEASTGRASETKRRNKDADEKARKDAIEADRVKKETQAKERSQRRELRDLRDVLE